ncbi:hypothetical protein C0Q70_21082 [Pomacea canaliculata]|uniref:RING-type E3 ubiquitin transferase n=2 Tax=Pomacea canaliculata TaxID=400727 RepID=A0A2T7NBI6_POMCA|nr:hypothetical protein C0Q70_21082 [Pomacea canaliculata]
MASKQSSSLQGDKETLDECKCPICMYILIEPVTLPCAHELCMPCYKKNVEEGSFTCPLCRTRISNWARKATKNNTLLDQKRWEQVKKLFPEKVQRRLDGLDDVTDEDDMNDNEEIDLQYRRIVQLSKPGEIREEYEAEVKRLDHGAEEERRREEEASVALIQELVTEDNQHIQKNQHLQQKIARQDEKLAQAESTSLVLTLMWCFLPHQNPQRDSKGANTKLKTVFKDPIKIEPQTSCKRKVPKIEDSNSSDLSRESPSKSRKDRGNSSNEDDEVGLSQEERDYRFALQLQKQFRLADKLHLKVLRFKGSKDAYSLRKRSQRK